jgi:hypothetical protein
MSNENNSNQYEMLKQLLEVQREILSTQKRIEVSIERIAKIAPFVLIGIAGLTFVVAGTS